MKSRVPEPNEIEIPELEEAMKTYIPKSREWTAEEIAIIRKYYKRVPPALLEKALPGRTINSIRQTAERYLIKFGTG